MSAIKQYAEVTEKLIHLAKSVQASDREAVIDEIEVLLDQREHLLLLIRGPYSSADQALGKKLLKLNKELEVHLGNVRMLIQKDLNELEQKKTSAERYANPYAATQQIDGMFYDKRK